MSSTRARFGQPDLMPLMVSWLDQDLHWCIFPTGIAAAVKMVQGTDHLALVGDNGLGALFLAGPIPGRLRRQLWAEERRCKTTLLCCDLPGMEVAGAAIGVLLQAPDMQVVAGGTWADFINPFEG